MKNTTNVRWSPTLTVMILSMSGSVGPEKRDALLRDAYALLHPINFSEPFGLSVIEAMACGTPVIAFNRGSMPELIKDGLNGYLVETVEQAIDAINKIHEIDRSACRALCRRELLHRAHGG